MWGRSCRRRRVCQRRNREAVESSTPRPGSHRHYSNPRAVTLAWADEGVRRSTRLLRNIFPDVLVPRPSQLAHVPVENYLTIAQNQKAHGNVAVLAPG